MSPRWKEALLEDVAEPRVEVAAWTFPRALDAIETAAWNRRMRTEDFLGRAALAVAVLDNDLNWDAITRLEPPMQDLRRKNLLVKRHFGRDFGDWKIIGMR